MFADEDGQTARDTYRPLLNAYLERLVDAASGWLNGASTKDYKGYDKMIAALKEDSFDGQLERGICWTGSPGEIADMIADYDRQLGGFDIASLHLMPHVMDVGVAEKSMRLFAEKVMRNFRGGLGSGSCAGSTRVSTSFARRPWQRPRSQPWRWRSPS